EIAYGTGTLGVPLWIDVAIPAAVLALVGFCAVVPALRAGRMSATAALAIGRAPRAGRGRAARGLLAGLPLPQPVGLGLGTPPTRPARYLSITVALIFGMVAITFAVGLTSSLRGIDQGLHYQRSVDVTVTAGFDGAQPGGEDLTAADAAAAPAALAQQRGTASYYGLTQDQVTVVGSTAAVNASLYTGATTSPYQLIAGHWYTGRDQVLAPTGFLNVTGTRVGDTITLVNGSNRRA